MDQAKLPQSPRKLTPPIVLRRRVKGDLERIFSDWLKSYRPHTDHQITNEVWYLWTHRILESFWVDKRVTFLLAVSPDDPNKIYGWMCGTGAVDQTGDEIRIIHYIYVPRLYRRLGVASSLLATFDSRPHRSECPIITTARTPAGHDLLKGFYAAELYNPFFSWGRAPVFVPANTPPAVLAKKDPINGARARLVLGGFVSSDPDATGPAYAPSAAITAANGRHTYQPEVSFRKPPRPLQEPETGDEP